ncbi:MAG: hypothetical protein D3913_15905, partial [Candidatus Electrothrix sp. LOE1_4_5]|nr:hypothetical protein [Candidatus Electrothrix gigas]
ILLFFAYFPAVFKNRDRGPCTFRSTQHFLSPLATNDKSFLIILVPEKSQMSIFFYRKIKKLIHCPEKHVTGLFKKEFWPKI